VKYVLSIYHDESRRLLPGDAGFDEMMAAFTELNTELAATEKLLAAEPLEPTTTATTLRPQSSSAAST
jgi:hypothetical protein